VKNSIKAMTNRLSLFHTSILSVLTFLILNVFIWSAKASEFQATLSCEFSGNTTTTAACLIKDGSMSYIEITTSGKPDVIQPYELHRLGQETRDGIEFMLSERFSFRVVNASDHLTLRLKIKDSSGNVVYEDAVGRLGVLYVGN
jgi:hypothetical protein